MATSGPVYFPDVIFQPLFLSALPFPPFTVPGKRVLAKPDERETCLYHFSLRLFTVVRSSCGPLDLGTDFLVGNVVFV